VKFSGLLHSGLASFASAQKELLTPNTLVCSVLSVSWAVELRVLRDETLMNFNLLPMFCWTLLVGFIGGPAHAQPVLHISSLDNQYVLHWPAAFSNFALQGTSDLSSSNWTEANDAVPAVMSDEAAVKVNSTPSTRYFRLVQISTTTADGMVLVPVGTFVMGDSLDGETDAVPAIVAVSSFYIDTNLVTYGLWQSVFSWATSHGYSFDWIGSGRSVDDPVQSIYWFDAVRWCNARSQLASLTPVYYTDPALTQLYTNSALSTIYPNWGASGYRLPTEAEWEKAARGKLSGRRFPWGDTISEALANYKGDTNTYPYDLGPTGYNPIAVMGGPPYTTPVSSFPPNGCGLFDMAGNVFQWCWDWYGATYSGGSDPRGPASGTLRVQRSCNFTSPAYYARCANRGFNVPASNTGDVGFRCVRRLSH
jgi:formylglycine-generating enzyme required for sulfatase activity